MPVMQVHDLLMNYSERGDGPTIIAFHAATSNGLEMGWMAQVMIREGFTVVTPDLRGHGATISPSSDLHLSRLVDDSLEFIYLLGRSPLHAAGFSLGGAVALYAARRRPELFRSLVLLGTSYHAPTFERVLKALGPLEDRSPVEQAVFDPVTGIGGGWDTPLESFGEVACPTLIIAADRDEFHDAEAGLVLYRVMPNAEILIVPRCDHRGLVRHSLVMEAIRGFYVRVPR